MLESAWNGNPTTVRRSITPHPPLPRIQGEDRAGVERLLRYCARPPFALERLYAPGGIVSLSSGHPPQVGRQARLSATQADGRTELLLSPIQFLERIARLIPPGKAEPVPDFVFDQSLPDEFDN